MRSCTKRSRSHMVIQAAEGLLLLMCNSFLTTDRPRQGSCTSSSDPVRQVTAVLGAVDQVWL